MIDGLCLPPKPAIILPAQRRLIHRDEPKLRLPALAGLLLNPYAFVGFQNSVGPLTLNTSDAWSSDYTHVVKITAATFAVVGGSQVRLTFTAGSSNLPITGCYIGLKAAAGDAYDFAAAPTQVLFAGSSSVTINASAAQASDAAAFVIDGTTDVLIAVQHTSVSNVAQRAAQSGFSHYYKLGAEASTVDKTGYTDYTATAAVWALSRVEVG